MTTTPNNKRLLGSQDLLTYYNLIPIYDKYVRPYPPPDRSSKLDPSLHSYIADLPGTFFIYHFCNQIRIYIHPIVLYHYDNK